MSAGVAKFWFAPLFGHSMAWPAEAAESFTTTKGENRLWPERLSSSTVRLVPPLVLLLEEELLLEVPPVLEDELDELLLEELEVLLELLLEDVLLELEELDEELEPLPLIEG